MQVQKINNTNFYGNVSRMIPASKISSDFKSFESKTIANLPTDRIFLCGLDKSGDKVKIFEREFANGGIVERTFISGPREEYTKLIDTLYQFCKFESMGK